MAEKPKMKIRTQFPNKQCHSTYILPNEMFRCSSDVADAEVDSGDDEPLLLPFFRMPLIVGAVLPTLIVTRVPPFEAALMPLLATTDC